MTLPGAPANAAAARPRSDAPPLAGRTGRPDASLALWMLGLTAIWGFNAVSVKVLTGGVSPVMGATLRNGVALALLTAFG
ncbi:MAG TPA: hypothetical protein VGC20_11835, partial [bacterium]